MDKCEADVAAEDYVIYAGFFNPIWQKGDWGDAVSQRMRKLWRHYPEAWQSLTVKYGDIDGHG